MEENVLNKVDELVTYIKSSPTYERYLVVKETLYNNKDIMNKINKSKELQKKIVKLEHNNKNTTEEEKEIESILKELEEYPVYLEHKDLVGKLNYEYSYIKDTLEVYMDNLIN